MSDITTKQPMPNTDLNGVEYVKELYARNKKQSKRVMEFHDLSNNTSGSNRTYGRVFDGEFSKSGKGYLRVVLACWLAQGVITEAEIKQRIYGHPPYPEMETQDIQEITTIASTWRKRQNAIETVHKLHRWQLALALLGVGAVSLVLVLMSSVNVTEIPVSSATVAQTIAPTTNSRTNVGWAVREWEYTSSAGMKFAMVYVPDGHFTMGYNNGEENERPSHQTYIGKGFWITRTEITQGQYGSVPDPGCNTNQVNPQHGLVVPNGTNYPMNCVTFPETVAYCARHGMRLPTEAEWEWAARGPSMFLYPWGNSFDSTWLVARTNTTDSAAGAGVPLVGSIPRGQSWVGAQDMAGSLREWTSTIYDPQRYPYPYNSLDGRENPNNTGSSQGYNSRTPIASVTSTRRVVRGGSFDDWGPDLHRLTRRFDEFFDFRFNIYGFRCVRDGSADSNEANLSG